MFKRITTHKYNIYTKYLKTDKNLLFIKPLDNLNTDLLKNMSPKDKDLSLIENNEEELLKCLQYCAHNHTDTNPFCKELLEKYDIINKKI